MVLLAVMEWEHFETQDAFREYLGNNYPEQNADAIIRQINMRTS
jgi:hypothetical protein